MRAHYLQHVPFEGLGSIDGWLRGAGYDITATRFYAAETLPTPEAMDLLVIMGGPMSLNDESDHPWLCEEKAFIRRVAAAGTPMLGICLGAQLIADAMGGAVFPNAEKEIGWFPVRGLAAGDAVFRFPESAEVFHWHGETFSLPPEAVRIAESDGCRNQAFQIGRRVMGLQFHLETTPDSARAIVDHCRDELVPGDYIQTEEAILGAPAARYRTVNALMDRVLDYLHRAGG